MLDPLDRHAWSQHVAEDVQLRATKTLARRGGGADRAVIFQQQKAPAIGAPFGHVAFARAEPGQPLDTRAERRGASERGAVGASGLLFANRDQLLQRGFAESGSHRLDQAHGQFGVGIGKAVVGGRCQMPDACRPPEAEFFRDRRNQAGVGEACELLTHRLGRGAECAGNVGRAERATPFEQPEDTVAGAVIQAHAWILRRPRDLRKPLLG